MDFDPRGAECKDELTIIEPSNICPLALFIAFPIAFFILPIFLLLQSIRLEYRWVRRKVRQVPKLPAPAFSYQPGGDSNVISMRDPLLHPPDLARTDTTVDVHFASGEFLKSGLSRSNGILNLQPRRIYNTHRRYRPREFGYAVLKGFGIAICDCLPAIGSVSF